MRRELSIRHMPVYHDYYSRLKSIALSVFQWDGLPHTCNERFLETCLFKYGCAIFVNDSEMGYLNLKATPANCLNVYHEPLSYLAFSIGYSKEYNKDECVFVRNNYLEKSTDSTITIYAEKLAAIDIAATINIDAQKTPILIRCDEKTRTSLNAVYNQYRGDKPVIFATKSMSERPFEVLKTDAPFLADKLREEKRAIWNEALEFLGINTNPSDKKKERLIVNEVDANNEQIDIQAETMLVSRVEACERINKMFGLSVNVERRVRSKETGWLNG